jgi:DNA-binding response OmpR family regulator
VLFETGADIPGADFRKRGIVAYLKKPFDLHEVVRYVKLLATRRQLAQARP